jgi:four helix bundle protein
MTNDLKARTKRFAVDILRFAAQLPDRRQFWEIAQQLVRCGCSVGANYRAACRARSRNDFLAKLSIVEEEADEAMYWLELLEEFTHSPNGELSRLKDEASQLTAITVASKKTARGKLVHQ